MNADCLLGQFGCERSKARKATINLSGKDMISPHQFWRPNIERQTTQLCRCKGRNTSRCPAHTRQREKIQAENSHQPTRERERRMRGLKSAGHVQQTLASFGTISSFFKVGRHLLAAKNYRSFRANNLRNESKSLNHAASFNDYFKKPAIFSFKFSLEIFQKLS